MDGRIVDAILGRIDDGTELVYCEEIAEEIFGPHYAASDRNSAARLESIREMLNEEDWDDARDRETRWYWERALEQFKVAPPKAERAAVMRAMRHVAAIRPDCEYRSGVLRLSCYRAITKDRLTEAEDRERKQVEQTLRDLQAIILGED
jgi:hypothetical protein